LLTVLYSADKANHDSGKVVGIYLGKTLIEKGIEINLPVPYSGLI